MPKKKHDRDILNAWPSDDTSYRIGLARRKKRRGKPIQPEMKYAKEPRRHRGGA